MNQTFLKLNNGLEIPQFGLGVYLIPDGKETINACLNAFKIGVKHIDTAHAYQNERSVGIAVKESGIKREEIWITTKLWPTEYGEGKTLEAIDKMLDRLQTDYIDLLLLHQQVGDYMAAYKDMEKAVKLNKVKSIGISNFDGKRLDEIYEKSVIKPSTIQVECHPYYPQYELKKKIEKYGTVLESWYPIGHGDKNLINEEIFTKLAKKYNKTNVQIILRWHIQENNVVFPKSTNPQHQKDNFNIFDFELTNEEMQEITKLDKGIRYYNETIEEQEKFLLWKPED